LVSADVIDSFPLGSVTVHRVGFGAIQLPGPAVFGPARDHDQVVAVLRRAVKPGVDHIDTAQYHGPSVSNELIREALHPYSDNLALVSKVGGDRDDEGGWIPAQRPEQLRAGVEANLITLGTDQLAAVNLRLMDAEALPPAQRVPLEDQLGEMVALRKEGKIAGVGIFTTTRAQDVDMPWLQVASDGDRKAALRTLRNTSADTGRSRKPRTACRERIAS
jgi:aryl-alcohol dehydrogenase-like predicted oxidoreductase